MVSETERQRETGIKVESKKTHLLPQQSTLTFRHTGWNEAGEVITATDNSLTGFPVMSGGAQVIMTFLIQHMACD